MTNQFDHFTHFSLAADPGCDLEAGAEPHSGGRGEAVQQRDPTLAQRQHLPTPALPICHQGYRPWCEGQNDIRPSVPEQAGLADGHLPLRHGE